MCSIKYLYIKKIVLSKTSLHFNYIRVVYFVTGLLLLSCYNPLFAQSDTIPTRDNNLALGNPSHATSALTDSNNYLIVKSQYALSYNNSKGMANWVSWHLSAAWKGSAARCNCFTQDTAVPAGYFRASTSNYTGTGFDRGHLCPSDDRDGSDTDNANTFKMSNISPQAPYLNEQTWGYLEDYCRSLIDEHDEMYIIAGGYGTGGSGSLGGITNSIAGGSINVPAYFWKIIVVLPVDTGDVARINTSTRVITVLMPNNDTVNRHSWDYYRVTVDSIQTLTGYNFLSNVDTAIQEVIEGKIDNGATPLLAWDFTGANAVATWMATSINASLDTSGGSANITRGSSAGSSAGANSFRTVGFQNDGISTANNDYYQVKMKARTGYTLSLATIDASYAGTSSFCASPGVTGQYAYSLDGSTYTLIGSPYTTVGTPSDMNTIVLTGITALQNIPATQTLYFRYYASGQTTTGGWGYYSSDTGNNGLSIGGTVNPIGTIHGLSILCAGSAITLSDTTSGGIWTSGNTAVATVGSVSGTVTGVSGGTATISYTVSESVFTTVVTVNPLPVAGTISGLSSVCALSSIPLTDASSGGTWTSSATTYATVGSTGIVTGVSAGSSTISYTVVNGCGSVTATYAITVNPLPVAGTISGLSSVCALSSIPLTDASSGGTWTSSATSYATVGSTGIVTGVSAGSSTISYTVVNGCGSVTATYAITVNPLPVAGTISGLSSVCALSSIPLTDASSGGTWTSSATTYATVGSTGIVVGVSAGTSTISYTVVNGCGSVTATYAITVNPLPVAGTISGLSSVCALSNIPLTDASPGGTWTSSATSYATVGSTGIVTGVSAGTSIISYTVANGCGSVTATHAVTVNPLPVAGTISGLSSVCTLSSISLTDASSGGTWTSSAISYATVGSTGIVTGVSAGTSIISYTVTNGCGSVTATYTVTVDPLPDAGIINGLTSVCESAAITLTDAATGGSWTSFATSYATVGSTGIVSGVSAGTSIISYTVTNGCGNAYATYAITINPLPVTDTISGASLVCVGNVITLSDLTTGGSWTSSDVSFATVGSSGDVTGVAAGTVTISYTVTNGCGSVYTLHEITVSSSGLCSTGVSATDPGKDVTVFPNPATTKLYITASVNTGIAIFSIDGRQLISKENVTEIDIRGLANGMYLIKVFDNRGLLLKTEKFVKTASALK